MKQILIGALVVLALAGLWYTLRGSHEFNPPTTFPVMDEDEVGKTSDTEPGVATFGSGCFWCTEAVFQRVKGVQSVVSGFSGGRRPPIIPGQFSCANANGAPAAPWPRWWLRRVRSGSQDEGMPSIHPSSLRCLAV